jgi:glucose/arabinose dehydrogenase/chitodextrinase
LIRITSLIRLRAVTIVAAVLLATLGSAVANPKPARAAGPSFVQTQAREIASGKTDSVAFAIANSVGNLVVATVLWNNTGAVTLADSRGNAYTSVAARRTWGSNWSEQTFFAKNIAAGGNSVSATFATTISGWAIVYIHEYAGIDKVNPLDGTTGTIGTAPAMSSGSLTTTVTGDLLFAAAASSVTVTAPGAGWTTRSTASGNRTEDRLAAAQGPYTATATQNGSSWVMQLVAFRPAVSDTTAPTVPTNLNGNVVSATQVNLGWTASTDNVGVAGYKVFRDGSQVATSTATTYQDTGLSPATSYTYAVSAYDAAGNESARSTSTTITTQPAPGDTTPPTVSLTTPTAGSTVSGTLTVSANASDNVGVVGVRFILDGVDIASEDTTAPYGVSWATTTATNGTHTLTARARDAAGNATTSSPVTVTVSNTTPPPAGIVAGYAFDDGSGTTAADASGHGITGTLTNGPTWGPGRYAGAINLDGVDDYVDLGNPASLHLTGSMTISAWINSSAFPTDDAAVVSKRGSIGFQLDTTVDRGARSIGFKLTNGTGADMIRYGMTALHTNTWYHVAGVYDAATGTMTVYLDGHVDNGAQIGTITGTQQDSPQNVVIGRRAIGGDLFTGSVDDVRIYDRALSLAEIQADMAKSLGPASSDTTPPSVSVTAPAAGAQVTGIVNVTASATDDVGVRAVQIYVDGVPTGAEDSTTPYGLAWDTRTAQNGAHTLTARARDAAGNSTLSAGVAVNITNADAFQNEVLATGFTLPTSIKFLPDGRMLVAELAGTVRVLPPPYTTPDPTPFLQITNIGSAGVQQGIFDIALDPAFTTNHYFYVFYTLGSPNRDRLSRFTADSTITGTVAGSETVLYQDPIDANAEHHGGAIMFGNDGKLYFTTGEHFLAANAQDLTSPRGKVHRINMDGTIPTDNPFYDGAGPNVDSIWALGLRNPYRAYYDAPTGRMYIGDVGGNDPSTAVEEVDVGARGANFGWPDTQGPCPAPCTSPLYSYPHNGRDSAVTGGFVYHGTQFPSSYQGDYFFADYTQNWIRRLHLDANGNVLSVNNFEPADGSVDGPYGDIVYLIEGPDGALYYVDLGYSDIGATYGISKIRRIRYIQSNQAPVAVASANPTSGPAPLAVTFSSAGSLDPEGQSLTYAWDFGDGTTSTAANPAHTYQSAGRYNARLTVSDGVNQTVATPIAISAGNPPVPSIQAPTDGAFFVAGDVISFSGDATDTEDGTLPASAYTWNIDFLHDGHVHPGTPITGVKSGTFTIPTTGHDFSGNTRYRITLTVVDSSGLTSSTFVTIWPRKVNLSFATAPSGLTLYLDGIARTTPFVYDTLTGFTHTIEARDQSAGATAYTFASWSDGGARQHSITVPATAQSYTATYTVSTVVTTPAFVQATAATPQTNLATVAIAYPGAQAAGDTNIVAVGWNDTTSTITSVTDSAGNAYQVAAPTARGPGVSQALYFAPNVRSAGPGANTVTVVFSTAVPYADVRITEYSGLDPSTPLDGNASASGTALSANSGNVSTAFGTELIFGAGITTGGFSGSPTGITTRLITTPDADIVNDRVVTSTGSYAALANVSGGWVMQVATFRAAGQ